MIFKCRRCGICCKNIYTAFSMATDVERWEREGRRDILLQLDDVGRMWVDPVTKEPIIGDCPFLKQDLPGYYSCKIQHTKPTMCRNFKPSKFNALNLGCKGYEDEK
jgi:Fe-S-cluster containining protein